MSKPVKMNRLYGFDLKCKRCGCTDIEFEVYEYRAFSTGDIDYPDGYEIIVTCNNPECNNSFSMYV